MAKNRVKELREALHMSQQMLGNEVGISQQVISKIERDDNRLTKDNLIHLADFFAVSTDYLLGRSKVRRSLEQERGVLDRYERNNEFIQIYELLGSTNQCLLRTLADKMMELEIKEAQELAGDSGMRR